MFLNSKVIVGDNSGIELVKLITNLTISNTYTFNINHICKGVILKGFNKKLQLYTSSLITGLLIQLKRPINLNKHGISYKCNKNSIILIDSNFNPIGSKILYTILYSKLLTNLKILTLSKKIIK